MPRLLPPLALALLAALALAAPAAAAPRTVTHTYGPVQVGGYSVDQQTVALPLEQTPNADAHITGLTVDIVDRPGGPKVPIRRLMLHHIVFLNAGGPAGARRDATCGEFTGLDSRTRIPNLAERFFAAGEERAVLGFPPGYGYRIRTGDRWLLSWMLMNHRRLPDRAYIEYTVTYDDDPGIASARPYWLDIANCKSDPVFDVPGGGRRGSTYRRSRTFTVPESGRIVAGGGHVHGGAKSLAVSQPDCGDRRLLTSRPSWGLPSHPFYNVRPVLHEPGPINMSGTLSQQGLPVAAGQRLKLTANYDGELPHTRVMGIAMVFIAPDGSVEGCRPLPSDRVEIGTDVPHRTRPPRFRVPLTGIGEDGRAREIDRPPGRTRAVRSGATLGVRDFHFTQPNVAVAAGARLNWRFEPLTLHNVTVANGPRGFSSPNLNDGRRYGRRLTRPGTYRLYCALHPVDMTQTVTVRRRGRR